MFYLKIKYYIVVHIWDELADILYIIWILVVFDLVYFSKLFVVVIKNVSREIVEVLNFSMFFTLLYVNHFV